MFGGEHVQRKPKQIGAARLLLIGALLGACFFVPKCVCELGQASIKHSSSKHTPRRMMTAPLNESVLRSRHGRHRFAK